MPAGFGHQGGKNPKGRDGQPLRCHTCGSQGHLMRDCPSGKSQSSHFVQPGAVPPAVYPVASAPVQTPASGSPVLWASTDPQYTATSQAIVPPPPGPVVDIFDSARHGGPSSSSPTTQSAPVSAPVWTCEDVTDRQVTYMVFGRPDSSQQQHAQWTMPTDPHMPFEYRRVDTTQLGPAPERVTGTCLPRSLLGPGHAPALLGPSSPMEQPRFDNLQRTCSSCRCSNFKSLKEELYSETHMGMYFWFQECLQCTQRYQ